jgi:hypothetical protein
MTRRRSQVAAAALDGGNSEAPDPSNQLHTPQPPPPASVVISDLEIHAVTFLRKRVARLDRRNVKEHVPVAVNAVVRKKKKGGPGEKPPLSIACRKNFWGLLAGPGRRLVSNPAKG